MMLLTPVKKQLLQVAADSGGMVDLTGPEWNPELPRTAMAVAVVLHNMGLGRLRTVGSPLTTEFSITDAGREALSQ